MTQEWDDAIDCFSAEALIDRATGSWLLYMMYFYPRTGQSLFWVQGFYDMELRSRIRPLEDLVDAVDGAPGPAGGGPPTGLW